MCFFVFVQQHNLTMVLNIIHIMLCLGTQAFIQDFKAGGGLDKLKTRNVLEISTNGKDLGITKAT